MHYKWDRKGNALHCLSNTWCVKGKKTACCPAAAAFSWLTQHMAHYCCALHSPQGTQLYQGLCLLSTCTNTGKEPLLWRACCLNTDSRQRADILCEALQNSSYFQGLLSSSSVFSRDKESWEDDWTAWKPGTRRLIRKKEIWINTCNFYISKRKGSIFSPRVQQIEQWAHTAGKILHITEKKQTFMEVKVGKQAAVVTSPMFSAMVALRCHQTPREISKDGSHMQCPPKGTLFSTSCEKPRCY